MHIKILPADKLPVTLATLPATSIDINTVGYTIYLSISLSLSPSVIKIDRYYIDNYKVKLNVDDVNVEWGGQCRAIFDFLFAILHIDDQDKQNLRPLNELHSYL